MPISCSAGLYKRVGAHGLLCADCWTKIDFIVPPLCLRLGAPLLYNIGEPSLLAATIADPPVYDRAPAAARYSSTMRDLFQSFKYGDRHEGLPLFGRQMAVAGAELLADVDAILLVPSTARGSGRGALTSRPWRRR